jgi:hypothetical protein
MPHSSGVIHAASLILSYMDLINDDINAYSLFSKSMTDEHDDFLKLEIGINIGKTLLVRVGYDISSVKEII